ncbi:MAG: DUF1273 family protein [Clostridia bacterium]|nr:DUF1273 family protein [Clostridia bacterium]
MSNVCCFAGHSKIYESDKLFSQISSKIEELIINKNVSEFQVGNYGSFDSLAARAVREVKKKYPHIQLNLVIPYLTNTINENKNLYYKNYDNILIAAISEKTPKRFMILKCNQYMVESSQFMICFVKYSWGGAAQTLKYAQKQKNIKIYNFAETIQCKG